MFSFTAPNLRRALDTLTKRLNTPDTSGGPLATKDPVLQKIYSACDRLIAERQDLTLRVAALEQAYAAEAAARSSAEAERQQLEQRWKRFTQTGTETFWELTVNARDVFSPRSVLWWSNALDGVWLPDRLDHLLEMIHPLDRELFRNALPRHVDDHSGSTDLCCECRLSIGKGEYRWRKIVGQASRDGQGTSVVIAGTLRDIHVRKLQEQQLTVAATRFEISREMLHDGLWDIEVAVFENLASLTDLYLRTWRL